MRGRGQGRGFLPGMKGRFRSMGYRMTEPRKEIITVLGSSDKHLSAEDVFFEVRKNNPGVGLATVYRTLEILVNMGVVNKAYFGNDGIARYELVSRGEKDRTKGHHHLVCISCGRIIDFSDECEEEIKMLEKMTRVISEKHAFKVNKYLLRFFGLCKDCQRK